MEKEQIVEVLETIATLLEFQKRTRTRSAPTKTRRVRLRLGGGNLRELAAEDRLGEIPGLGKAIAGIISELVLTGSSKFYDELRAQFPHQILELFPLPGLGSKKIKALFEKLAVTSIADLAHACADGRVGITRLWQSDPEKTRKDDRGSHETRRQLFVRRSRGRVRANASGCEGASCGVARQHRGKLPPETNRELYRALGQFSRRRNCG